MITKVISTIFLAFNLLAADIKLHDLIESRGKELKAGQSIELTNRNEVEFIKTLGSGNTTIIHEVKSGTDIFALRVPKYHGAFNTFSKYTNYIDAFYLGHTSLETQGVAIPKIYNYEKEKYLLVEKLNLENSFDLEDFFLRKEKIDSSEFAKAFNQLPEFFESVAAYTLIKDFHLKQLVYSPKEGRWILMDWTHSHELFTELTERHPFSLESIIKQAEKYDQSFNPSDEFKELLSHIEISITKRREQILESDEKFLSSLTALNSQQLLEAIENPPKGYSNNLTLGIIEIISKKTVPSSVPAYLIANHGDYKFLLEKFLENTDSVDDLAILLNLKDPLGMKIDWNLEMKIQKIITNSDINNSTETYKSLLDHSFVTSYAKAWIKRERLDIATSQSCSEAVKGFLRANP